MVILFFNAAPSELESVVHGLHMKAKNLPSLQYSHRAYTQPSPEIGSYTIDNRGGRRDWKRALLPIVTSRRMLDTARPPSR